ncbi:hypothetical protein PN462_13655, partial [Spirulina sp. CS-785/01]|uniref:WD40 repeat domain-containing protein n=1 Tax=Spirulina sp. CS-785/01 TaxID=3021716 RepID=UPI002A383D41|nr:hypothetical protein [Spirulina sp. CS-785/01]
VNAVAVTPEGQVISGSGDNTLKVWDMQTGKELRTLRGHSDWVYAVAVTPEGQVISGSVDNTLKVWDMQTGEVLTTFTTDTPILSCAVSGDGRTVVAGDTSGRVYFLRLEGG